MNEVNISFCIDCTRASGPVSKPVKFSNRFIGIGSVFEPVLLKKQFWNQFSQKYFKFNLNFGSFIDTFFIYLKPVS
jgi:hypothetical protein